MTQLRSAPRPAWLGALLAALLMALLAPALAWADDGAAGGTAVAEQPAGATAGDTPAATDEASSGTSAAADEATPAEDSAAPDASAATDPAATDPVAPPAAQPSEGTSADAGPTAPPSGGEVDLPGVALLPGGELAPTEAPSPQGEALATTAPSLPELVPLIAAPEVPRAMLVVPVVEVPQALPGGPAGALTTVRVVHAATVGAGVLGGPPAVRTAVPPAIASRAAAGDGPVAAAAAMPLRAAVFPFDPVDPAGLAGAGAGERDLGPATAAFGADDATARIAAPQLVAPGGPAPAQSLLAVLASYILPGSGPVPAGAIFLLVMLGVVLLAAYAPRPGGSERIWLSGLLGPSGGHGMAVRRPG